MSAHIVYIHSNNKYGYVLPNITFLTTSIVNNYFLITKQISVGHLKYCVTIIYTECFQLTVSKVSIRGDDNVIPVRIHAFITSKKNWQFVVLRDEKT